MLQRYKIFHQHSLRIRTLQNHFASGKLLSHPSYHPHVAKMCTISKNPPFSIPPLRVIHTSAPRISIVHNFIFQSIVFKPFILQFINQGKKKNVKTIPRIVIIGYFCRAKEKCGDTFTPSFTTKTSDNETQFFKHRLCRFSAKRM